jgi:chromosome segregation ATPase
MNRHELIEDLFNDAKYGSGTWGFFNLGGKKQAPPPVTSETETAEQVVESKEVESEETKDTYTLKISEIEKESSSIQNNAAVVKGEIESLYDKYQQSIADRKKAASAAEGKLEALREKMNAEIANATQELYVKTTECTAMEDKLKGKLAAALKKIEVIDEQMRLMKARHAAELEIKATSSSVPDVTTVQVPSSKPPPLSTPQVQSPPSPTSDVPSWG